MRFDPRARARALAFASAVMLLLNGTTLKAAEGVIEKTVAFVNRRPVLMSDVELSRALLAIPEADAVERTIDEALMSDEASRVVSDSLSDEEIASATATLKEKAGPAFSNEALRRKAVVQLTISKYIELRLRPLVRVEDADVRRIYNEHVAQDPFTPEFSTAAPSIREVLERRALDQRIEEWVASLRRRDEIRRPPARKR